MADTDDGMGALTTVVRTVVVWGTWDEMFGSANQNLLVKVDWLGFRLCQ